MSTATMQPANPEPGAAETRDRWSPLENFQRLVEEMWNRTPMGRLPMPRMFESMPALNMHREDGSLIVEAAMPGMDRQDIKINIADRILTIEAEHKTEKRIEQKDRYLAEVHSGRLYRQVQLPLDVDAALAKASYDRGMLRLTIPVRQPEHQDVTVAVD